MLVIRAVPAGAQIAPGAERPGDRRPELPDFEKPEGLPRILLPSPREPATELAPGLRIEVKRFEITGSTVFDEDDFAEVTAPYLGRSLSTQDLQQLRKELTLLYVNAGYTTSGAVLPDQDPSGGVVEIRIVEGRLASVVIDGLRYSSATYLRRRLETAAGMPLRPDSLNDELQLLQLDPRFDRIQAELAPGNLPGEATLRVRIDEAVPFDAFFEIANHVSPLVGPNRARLELAHTNLFGRLDVLSGRLSLTEGLVESQIAYEVPVTRYETRLGALYRSSDSTIIEPPFDSLGISSETQTAAISLRQPLIRTYRNEFELFAVGEWRHSETPVFDLDTTVSVVRTGVEWLHRTRRQVLAARAQVSFGIDALGSTIGGSAPDSDFTSFLGQLQWVRRLPFWDAQVLARFDVQLANGPLPSVERFAMGGQRQRAGLSGESVRTG